MLIFNISGHQNSRQLLLRAVCGFVNTLLLLKSLCVTRQQKYKHIFEPVPPGTAVTVHHQLHRPGRDVHRSYGCTIHPSIHSGIKCLEDFNLPSRVEVCTNEQLSWRSKVTRQHSAGRAGLAGGEYSLHQRAANPACRCGRGSSQGSASILHACRAVEAGAAVCTGSGLV